MPIKHGFFNSRGGDRTYSADDITSYLEGIVGNGVFPQPSTSLQVVENSGMMVSVLAGKAWIDGYWLKSNSTHNITIDQSDVTNDRMDRIVVRLDKEARTVSLAYKKGTPELAPSAPALVRNDNVKEYSLATITISKQAKAITQANIHDDRPDDSVCGFVKGLIEEIGTETLLLQYESMWKQYFEKSTDDFNAWFGDLKENLSTSTLIRQFSGVYTTTEQDQKNIPIPIEEYVDGLDILDVYVNGLMFIEGVHYRKNGPKEIVLTLPLDINQDVYFIAFKSIDGKDAVKVIDQVADLQREMPTVKTYIKKNVSVETGAWVKSGPWYVATLNDANVTADHIVDVNFHLDSLEVASNAQVQNITESGAGTIKLYAKNIPTTTLVCDYSYVKGVAQ